MKLYELISANLATMNFSNKKYGEMGRRGEGEKRTGEMVLNESTNQNTNTFINTQGNTQQDTRIYLKCFNKNAFFQGME